MPEPVQRRGDLASWYVPVPASWIWPQHTWPGKVIRTHRFFIKKSSHGSCLAEGGSDHPDREVRVLKLS